MTIESIRPFISLARKHPRYFLDLVRRKILIWQRGKWIKDGFDCERHWPLIYRLTLTHACNLRCSMCYEWGSSGWCAKEGRGRKNEELPIEIVEKILRESPVRRPFFILIGGEPLLYPKYRELAILLRKKKCFSVTCTNGLLLGRYLDLFEENPYHTLLVSLDGVAEVNDQVRGTGVFKQVVNNLEKILKKRRCSYVGIQCTIQSHNLNGLEQFCEEMVGLGVDWILFNALWYVNKEDQLTYKEFMCDEFSINADSSSAYPTDLEVSGREILAAMERIKKRKWPIQISSYLKSDEDAAFYSGSIHFSEHRKVCYKQWFRMDVLPTGDVVSCALFPDYIVGNLSQQSLHEVWNSDSFSSFRELSKRTNLPVCKACDAIYLYDRKRKIL